MNADALNTNTEMQYCCMLCMETSISKETGAKMCRNCQKVICSTCFRTLQKKQQYVSFINSFFIDNVLGVMTFSNTLM